MADCNVNCNKGISMMQGDSWPLEFSVTLGGQPVAIEEVETVEASLDGLVKTWPNGGVEYDGNKAKFAFWPSQEETFKLRGLKRFQVRVKLKNTALIGFDFGVIRITESNSKEVL